ncbi:FMN-dependent NADH-azoreductase [Embleya sp. NPDC055664]
MPSLLHLDASMRRTGSVSRLLSAHFAARWRERHPSGAYTYRDLAAQPIPHLTHAVREALVDPGAEHGAPADEWALTTALNAELRAASTVVMGVPMYNYSIPSTIKTWLDRVVSPATMAVPGGEPGPLAGTSVIVISPRGGSYAPGTPRAGWDHQEPYLRAVLGAIGRTDDLTTFVPAELTLAAVVPQMAALKPLAEQSLERAYRTLETLAGRDPATAG